jgi:hypothetical protein
MFQAVHMNHSLYSADRQTHRRIVGSAFVATLIITMVCGAVIPKFERHSAQPSIAVLRVATTDGGNFPVR